MRYITEEHLISAIVVWLLFVSLKAFAHFYIIQIEKIDPHKSAQTKIQNWIFTGMASGCDAVLFNLETAPEFFTILFFQVMWHQVMFAPMLNKLRKLGFFYLGLESGGFDEYFVKRPSQHRILYVVYCTLAIVSIYLLNIIFR